MSDKVNDNQMADNLFKLYKSIEYNDFVSHYNMVSKRFEDLPQAAKLTLFYEFVYNNGKFSNDLAIYKNILYDRNPVDIDTFLDSPDYMGSIGRTIYPLWRKELREFLADDSTKNEWVHSGAIGTGKTTVSRVVSLYRLYQMCCLRHPQATFGLTPETTISMIFVGISQKKSRETALKPFVQLLRYCKVFEELSDQTKLLTYTGDKIPFVYNIADNAIRLGKNIFITVGSSIDDLIGMSTFAVFYDEAESGGNVREVLDLYAEIKNRIKSRFGFSKYNFASIISSARKQNGAIQTYINSLSAEDYDYVLVSEYTKWEVAARPGDDPFVDGYFYVLNGTLNYPSQILSNEKAEYWLENTKEIPGGCEILKIPINYILDFRKRLEKSLQDIAGVPTATNSAPFSDLTKIEDSRLAPSIRISIPTVRVGDDDSKENYILSYLPDMCTVVDNLSSKRDVKWFRYPNALRYIHIDLAEVGECGFSMVHKEKNLEGEVVYVVDLAITFYSPTRIKLDRVMEFIIELKRKFNFKIHTLTFDQYQSAIMKQRAEELYLATKCAILSVERTPDPYFYLANQVSLDNFKIGECSGKYDLIEQMQSITEDENGKIVKPYITNKNHCDLLDGVVGATWNAYNNHHDIPTVLYLDVDEGSEANEEAILAEAMKRLNINW